MKTKNENVRHYLSELPHEEVKKLILYPSEVWNDLYEVVAEDNGEYASDLIKEILGNDYDEDEVEKYVKDTKEKYDEWYRDSGWYSSTEWRDDNDPRRAENIRIAKLDYYLNTKALPEFDDWYYPLAEYESEIYSNNTNTTLKENHE